MKRLLSALVAALSFACCFAGANAQVATKSMSWGQLTSGDCQMLPGSTVVFRSDGSGTFTATTLTLHTHSGDVWHHSIQVTSTDGHSLFVVGPWNSPRMNDGNPSPQYPWTASFNFDPAIYGAIGSASAINYSC